jgi:hypothetical protein
MVSLVLRLATAGATIWLPVPALLLFPLCLSVVTGIVTGVTIEGVTVELTIEEGTVTIIVGIVTTIGVDAPLLSIVVVPATVVCVTVVVAAG